MSKVTITFEDQGRGLVKIVSDPTFEMMVKMNLSGHEWTGAQGYALFALNRIREESRKRSPMGIGVPRVWRP